MYQMYLFCLTIQSISLIQLELLCGLYSISIGGSVDDLNEKQTQQYPDRCDLVLTITLNRTFFISIVIVIYNEHKPGSSSTGGCVASTCFDFDLECPLPIFLCASKDSMNRQPLIRVKQFW
jgi:hypothetical protein